MTTYIFDFDSTITQVEALDILAEIVLKDKPERDEVINEIKQITDLGIDGDISFTESLERRIKLLNAHRDDLTELISRLEEKISESFNRNVDFFKSHKDQIKVISCGFKEFIDPIVEERFGIASDCVSANTFTFDDTGYIIGFDKTNVLSKHNGKIDCLKQLNLPGEIQVIGDGYSDYVMREAGVADKFFAYTENVNREKAVVNADFITNSLDEFLYINKLPRKISYPKNRIKILLLENIHQDAYNRLSKDGFSVELISTSLGEEELLKKIKGVHVLGIRSKTQVTQKILYAADKLLVVSAFCIGTTQIDLKACKERGVIVFNAPYSNTRSVVELAIGQIVMLMRSIFPRSQEMHKNRWNKTAKGAQEIRHKKLGIIGYGNIGKQLSVLAEAIGMRVYFYDIDDQLAIGNAVKCNSMEQILRESDVVSLHVDDNRKNNKLIGERELKMMKKGSYLINLSRGFVVDIEALEQSLRSEHLAGAALDVFPVEPLANGNYDHSLSGLSNVILTPHIGGSTFEAQKDIADFVPRKIMGYINSGNTVDAVNFPNIRLPKQDNAHRFLHIHKNVPGVMAEINNVLASYGLNISGQYLSTDNEVGYVITDISNSYDEKVIDALKEIGHTIKLRILY